jgi:hypothetical protein
LKEVLTKLIQNTSKIPVTASGIKSQKHYKGNHYRKTDASSSNFRVYFLQEVTTPALNSKLV